jgi:glycerol dehydrogenase
MATTRTLISPSRYVQGKGAIHGLGEHLTALGSAPLLVADDVVWGFVGHDVTSSLEQAGLPVTREGFGGLPTAAEVDRLVGVIGDAGADVVVAIGGGSTMVASHERCKRGGVEILSLG